MDTIFALSSGLPPAAIAVLRISGSGAGAALIALAGKLPTPRRASLMALRHPASGDLLDRALVLWFPGPATATGEDLAEIHAHGGRAVVEGIELALASLPGTRGAVAGEFTRRALDHGRIDLAEAEGLADLLQAQTQWQRRQALAVAGGSLSRAVEAWQHRLLMLSAQVEATLDFEDEDDVARTALQAEAIAEGITDLRGAWADWLAKPVSETLFDGLRVAIGGPPNSGKSTLINALAQREAAIVSPQAGTTRDIVEAGLVMEGVAMRIADTAGLRDHTDDGIEAQGIARARDWIGSADLLLWLGDPADAPDHPKICRIAPQADRFDGPGTAPSDWQARCAASDIVLSAVSGAGMAELQQWLVSAARTILPQESDVALNRRQAAALAQAWAALGGPDAELTDDPLVQAEQLRHARLAIDTITGRAGTEAMLDALFGRFCIGK